MQDDVCGAYSDTMSSIIKKGNDVLQFPGAVLQAGTMIPSNICGNNGGLRANAIASTTVAQTAGTICCEMFS